VSQTSNEAKQRWLENNMHKRPEINRNSRLRREYGISPEDYHQMIEDQNGRCAICKRLFTNDKAMSPHVDHDHSTKWVRGLLCNTCNTAIGMFREDPYVMAAAIDYIIYNSTPTEFSFSPLPNPQRQHTEEWKAAASLRHKGNKYKEGKEPWNKGLTYSLPRKPLPVLYEREDLDGGI